jgi:ADP-ribose pyrophosphatase YjhB (NUDIX family)
MKIRQIKLKNAVIASGPIIIESKKMLVVLDKKDPFLKFPGGSLFVGKTLKETCILETKREIKCDIEILRELESLLLWKKPHTGEKIPVVLIHWLAKIKKDQKPREGVGTKRIIWIDSKYKGYELAPNVDYFLRKLKKQGLVN